MSKLLLALCTSHAAAWSALGGLHAKPRFAVSPMMGSPYPDIPSSRSLLDTTPKFDELAAGAALVAVNAMHAYYVVLRSCAR